MVPTKIVWPEATLRAALGLKPHEAVGTRPVGTADGEFRREPDARWRLWTLAPQIKREAE